MCTSGFFFYLQIILGMYASILILKDDSNRLKNVREEQLEWLLRTDQQVTLVTFDPTGVV